MRISDWSSDVCSSDLSVQDVPIAISAFNTEMVEASGTTTITSLNGLARNVVLQTQGLVANVPMISIRGMSTADPDPNADPNVSTIDRKRVVTGHRVSVRVDIGRCRIIQKKKAKTHIIKSLNQVDKK